MSAAATLPAPSAEGVVPASKYHLTFGRVLRSEFVKFRTLRSTVWTLAITIVVLVGLATLFAAIFRANLDNIGSTGAEAATTPIVTGVGFGQLVLAVLGALTITGEYSTGMIRSTFSAVPTRTPALVAKAVVVVVSALVVTAIATAITVAVITPILSGSPIALDLSDPDVLRVVVGTPLYLAGIALLALALGILIRNSAGAIFGVIGLVLVINPILSGIPVKWVNDWAQYLPSAAGQQLLTVHPTNDPAPWPGLLVLFAWGVVLFGIGVFLAKKRDA
ncbi:ABC transporter permease [Luteimicrobium xylanilyticum]|uniref:ABC transporter permease n=1 Tax=Luteimicrobium xylanilyticum TaxID=1133546 RepID=A0A5P9QCL8_9MICO|nr:ABC transporter permease subunit [Luteimicrobium xylanilyticum]QFU99203.1 hypothetical protein KDY119_02729 [Luteimicrobium xylanilyticum]